MRAFGTFHNLMHEMIHLMMQRKLLVETDTP